MTVSVLVVDHHDSFTFNLVHLVAEVTGELPDVVEHDEVASNDLLGGRYSHVVLSPGPGHPARTDDFAVGRDLVSQGEVPVLGVCLGMQGLVVACGGTVEQVEPVHGGTDRLQHDGTGLFDGVPFGATVVRYHSLAATAVRGPLRVTATGADGTVMAVTHRTLPHAGVQFHPESVLTEHGDRMVANFLAGRR